MWPPALEPVKLRMSSRTMPAASIQYFTSKIPHNRTGIVGKYMAPATNTAMVPALAPTMDPAPKIGLML